MMKQRKKHPWQGLSLQWSLNVLIVVCWLLPLLATLLISAGMSGRNIQSHMEETISASVTHAMFITQ